ncbi:MAG TPA: hypothetical protein VMM13_21225, partial [Euzebya sp.]|nr:hypothetical protein [Euzebya sp.]
MTNEFPRRWSVALLVIAVLVSGICVALGAIGYTTYLPDAEGWEIAYEAIRLLVFEAPEAPDAVAIPPVLHAARLLAVIPPLSTIASAFVLLGQDQVRRWQAIRASGHVVVLGGSATGELITSGYRADGQQVVVIDVDPSADQRADALPGGDDRLLARICRDARSVVVALDDDQATVTQAARIVALLPQGDQPAPTAVRLVLDDPDLAGRLRPALTAVVSQTARIDVCARHDRMATGILRDHPPAEEGAAGPPPVIVGDGPLAAALLTATVRGWAPVGDAMPVVALTTGEDWATRLLDELGPHIDLTVVSVPAEPRRLAEAAQKATSAWQPTDRQVARLRLTGPRVYLAGLPTFLAQAVIADLRRGLPDARIVAVVPSPQVTLLGLTSDGDGTVILTDEELLTRPDVLEADAVELIARELHQDHRRWRDDRPTALGAAPAEDRWKKLPDPARARYAAVAAAVTEALEQAGCAIGPVGTAVVLQPDELVAVAGHLASATRADRDDPDGWYGLLELAG